MPNSKRTK